MRIIHTLTPEECDTLLTALIREVPSTKRTRKGLRNYTMALLMLDAGLRVGEVSKLLIADLIVEGQTVKSLRVSKEIAKGHRERTIPVSARLGVTIQHMWKFQWSKHHEFGTAYAFYNTQESAPITPRQIQRILSATGRRVLGKGVRPHMLRHTFATRLMRITPMPVVQRLLGHSSMQSTQIYTHPNSDDLTMAIKSIEANDIPGNSQKT